MAAIAAAYVAQQKANGEQMGAKGYRSPPQALLPTVAAVGGWFRRQAANKRSLLPSSLSPSFPLLLSLSLPLLLSSSLPSSPHPLLPPSLLSLCTLYPSLCRPCVHRFRQLNPRGTLELQEDTIVWRDDGRLVAARRCPALMARSVGVITRLAACAGSVTLNLQICHPALAQTAYRCIVCALCSKVCVRDLAPGDGLVGVDGQAVRIAFLARSQKPCFRVYRRPLTGGTRWEQRRAAQHWTCRC